MVALINCQYSETLKGQIVDLWSRRIYNSQTLLWSEMDVYVDDGGND